MCQHMSSNAPRAEGRVSRAVALSRRRSQHSGGKRPYACTHEGGMLRVVQPERLRPRLTGEDWGVPRTPASRSNCWPARTPVPAEELRSSGPSAAGNRIATRAASLGVNRSGATTQATVSSLYSFQSRFPRRMWPHAKDPSNAVTKQRAGIAARSSRNEEISWKLRSRTSCWSMVPGPTGLVGAP